MSWALLAAGCNVQLKGLEGRPCSVSHPCPAELLCQAGACRKPPLSDDAGVRWQQTRSGFSGTSVGQDCTAVVDSADGNTLRTTVMGDAPRNFAIATVDQAFLPQRSAGRIGGAVTLESSLASVPGHLQVLSVLNANGDNIVSLEFAPQRIVYFTSAPGTISDAGLAQGPSADNFPALAPLVTPGVAQLALAWVPGQYFRVLVNGINAFEQPLSGAGSAGAAIPYKVVLGISTFSGTTPDGGFAMVFRDWQMSGDPEATFTP